MLKITDLFIDGGRTRDDLRYALTAEKAPEFMWALSGNTAFQESFRLRVIDRASVLWDTGRICTRRQKISYDGKPLPVGRAAELDLQVWGDNGEHCTFSRRFMYACCRPEAEWIGIPGETSGRAVYFSRSFRLREQPLEAVLYVCGLGYHSVKINNTAPDDSLLEPSHTNYAKTACYSVKPVKNLLKQGDNLLSVIVAEGWRNNGTEVTRNAVGGREIEFMGPCMLWAQLEIEYADGSCERIMTGRDWTYSFGPIVSSGIYAGESYDAGAGITPAEPVILADGPGGTLVPDLLEPIRCTGLLDPVDITFPSEDCCILDFGSNISGVLRLRLPENMEPGAEIEVKFAEELDEDGNLFTAPLRGALCTDTYRASGDSRDLKIWQPVFTYHGFRYASIKGISGCPEAKAAVIRSDMRNRSFFRCGSPTANAIWQAAVRTDACNIHSIMTDCPQRDERMGWMNDATGRFSGTPYCFDTGRIFPKIIRDIMNEQRPEGQFTCCCPFYYGALPADPVCSSFLVAARELLMHTGNADKVREILPDLWKWESFLLSRSNDYIVDYSHYGDWAGPSYACLGEELPLNAHTEGIIMSTGFSYYNCILLEQLARLVGEPWREYRETGEKIKAAMLRRWWNDSAACFAKGSMGSQAFALWLGIIPEDRTKAAAEVMVRDLRDRDYRFTTGNQTTQLLLEMLCRYGYTDDAWKLFTREAYPSWGYMLQNEATTIWERFELKKDPGMNSHSHPMHGNAVRMLYAYIAGITPAAPGWDKALIRPHLPTELLSCQMAADTCRGMISVRWAKRYGSKRLWVQLPVGMTGRVEFEGISEEITPGFHSFEVKER